MPLAHEMRLSEQGRDLLAEREGMRLKAYRDSVGIWTIGLGHVTGPPKVTPGLTITEDEAWEIFRRDVETFRKQLAGVVKVELEQHQFDALASFIFNIGAGGFKRSTVLKRLNASDYAGAAQALLMWTKPKEITSRRRGEHFQFLGQRFEARVT